LPDWVGAEEPMIPADLQIYLDAAQHFEKRQGLYLQGSLEKLEEHYPYAPPFALGFTPFLRFAPSTVAVMHTILHFVAYAWMYIRWGKIFQELNLNKANEFLASTLPLWLVFSAFWGDLGYLNIYLIMAFIGTLFIEAVLKERLVTAAFWLAIILQIKPHWAFAAAVPLFLGRYRFFAKLILLALAGYIAIVGLTVLIGGVDYVFNQYSEYVQFLSRLSHDFPWRGPEDPFLGYNHSIKQIVVYLLGTHRWAFRLATLIKILCLLPLGFVGFRFIKNPPKKVGYDIPRLALDWAFVLYLGAFIWLDMVWELSLGIAVFVYLLGTLQSPTLRKIIWIVFPLYALVDLIQVLSFAIFGMDIIAPGPYILTDPSIYLPLIMAAILSFYVLLICRLWQTSEHLTLSEAI
jgi:hypothetical protein